jgi:hypothetical protein
LRHLKLPISGKPEIGGANPESSPTSFFAFLDSGSPLHGVQNDS